jgi:signal peptidase I
MMRILVRGVILAAVFVAALALTGIFAAGTTLAPVHPVAIAAGWFLLLISFWYVVELALRWKRKVPAKAAPHSQWQSAARLAALAPVVLIALAILAVTRSVAVEPLSTAGRSMEPTIASGDYLLISKFAYGYSRYSFPFELVPISGRFMGFGARRGDVVAFRDPRKPWETAVSRVLGVPHDRVRMIKGRPYINGEALKRERMDDVTLIIERRPTQVRQWRETQFDGLTYRTLDMIDDGAFDDMPEVKVPPGYVFLVSDNRDSAADSRFKEIGPVPYENLVGRILFCLRSPCSG